jgi:predicted nuclease of predicted toxin-antitoxin system
MRLLFDENLSPKLCGLLDDIFPGSQSVLRIGLGGKSDIDVWQYAIENGMIVVSKDSDFVERAIIWQGKAKLIWLRLGNCTTEAAHLALRSALRSIVLLERTDDVVLELE